MDDKTGYADLLEAALSSKIGIFDDTDLRRLKDAYKLFQTAFKSVYAIILKKGLVQEDPYKYELKISEVTTPPENSFPESEKSEQMRMRLSQFESYLDFLNNFYQFSVDFLTMGRIKRLVALTKYFNFLQFSDTNPHPNTKYFAELVQQVRKGTDQLSTGILNDALSQLEKASREIFQVLKDLAFLHRERFKLTLHKSVLPGLPLDRDWVITHREDAVRKARLKFSETQGEKPFYPELAEEALLEVYGSESQVLKDEVLRKLAVQVAVKKSEDESKNYRALILDGVRTMISSGYQLADAIQKLVDNQAIIDGQDKSFMGKLRKTLREMMGKPPKAIMHETEYLDPVSGERRLESVDFLAFTGEAQKKAQGFIAMIPRNSPSYKRIENATEDQAYKFLEKSIEELQRYFRTVTALDEFFRSVITAPEDKPRVRGVKLELTTIKNSIIKANQKKYEYIAAKEESEQMKRLGLRPGS